MSDLLFLGIAIGDGIAVGIFAAILIMRLLGNSPMARLARLVVSVGSGITYSLWCIHICWGETDISMEAFLVFFFGPIVVLGIVLVILKIIEYMYKK